VTSDQNIALKKNLKQTGLIYIKKLSISCFFSEGAGWWCWKFSFDL